MRKNISPVLRNVVIALGLLFPAMAFGSNTITIGNAEVAAGGNCTIEIKVTNTDQFTAFQTDIVIPQGFSFVAGSAQLNPERIDGHTLSAGVVNNTLRIIAFSISNTAFLSNSGALLSFSLKANTSPGNYQLTPLNTSLGNSNSENILTDAIAGVVTVLCPDISVSSSTLNFGRVALTHTGNQNLTIYNTGNQDLVISELVFSDMQFSSSDSDGFTIAPGSNKTITVIFAPQQKGNFNKFLQINSNDPDEETITVDLSALGYTINELHCGNMTGASGTTHRLDLSINNMEAFYAFQFDLNVPSALQYIQDSIFLFRNGDHQVQASMINPQVLRVVVFSPTGTFFTGNDGKIISLGFNINGNAGYYPLNLQNVVISNVDIENITSDIYHGLLTVSSPDIHANTALNFGDVSILEVGEQILTIYNYGQEPLVIDELTFSNALFSCNDQLPITIQPYNNHNLTIKFQKQTKGSATGNLRIFSNDPDEYPFVVNLSGNAYVPNFIVVDSYTFTQGDSSVIAIEIKNKEEFVAFQFDFEYPDGLVPVIGSATLTNRKADHQLSISQINNNTVRIIAWTASLSPFTGEEGHILLIPFKVDADLTTGNYPLNISNGVLSSSNNKDILYGVVSGHLTVNKLNSKPIAHAGPDQSVNEGSIVTLDGSGSNDPDGDTITYLWSVPEGIVLSDVTAQKPTFTTPEVIEDTQFEFILVVSDGELSSAPDSVVVAVKNAGDTIEIEFTINNFVLFADSTKCFNALENIVISGNETVIFEQGSYATLIAGHSIRFLPGFQAQAGSNVIAYITTNGSFCDQLPQAIVVAEQLAEKGTVIDDVFDKEKEQVAETEQSLKVYPNPNNGIFTLQFANLENNTRVIIFNTLGQKVYETTVNGNTHLVDLPNIQRGIYLVKVINSQKQFDRKVLIQ